MVTNVVTFVVVGCVFAILGVPLLKRKIAPNFAYGLRISATLNNQTIWYEANARCGRDMILAGVCIAIVAIAVFLLRVPMNLAAWINLGFMAVAVIASGLRGFWTARSLARRQTRQ